MTYERISLEFDDKVAILKFNHPKVMNAIGAQMLGELGLAVRISRTRLERLRSAAPGMDCVAATTRYCSPSATSKCRW
jgi:hypothetical protein